MNIIGDWINEYLNYFLMSCDISMYKICVVIFVVTLHFSFTNL